MVTDWIPNSCSNLEFKHWTRGVWELWSRNDRRSNKFWVHFFLIDSWVFYIKLLMRNIWTIGWTFGSSKRNSIFFFGAPSRKCLRSAAFTRWPNFSIHTFSSTYYDQLRTYHYQFDSFSDFAKKTEASLHFLKVVNH